MNVGVLGLVVASISSGRASRGVVFEPVEIEAGLLGDGPVAAGHLMRTVNVGVSGLVVAQHL